MLPADFLLARVFGTSLRSSRALLACGPEDVPSFLNWCTGAGNQIEESFIESGSMCHCMNETW
eukprot:scaffold438_cov250-Pinguiococcus_pyrenoidosus.AAC.37